MTPCYLWWMTFCISFLRLLKFRYNDVTTAWLILFSLFFLFLCVLFGLPCMFWRFRKTPLPLEMSKLLLHFPLSFSLKWCRCVRTLCFHEYVPDSLDKLRQESYIRPRHSVPCNSWVRVFLRNILDWTRWVFFYFCCTIYSLHDGNYFGISYHC